MAKMTDAAIRDQLIALSTQIGQLQLQFWRLKQRLKEQNRKVDGVTVYEVRETKVKSYVRRGYSAVRVVDPNFKPLR